MKLPWSIRARILVVALLPAVCLFPIASALLTMAHVRTIEVDLSRRGQFTATHVASLAEYALFAGNLDELDKLARSALGESDVVRVRIRDTRGSVSVHAEAANVADRDADLLHFEAPVIQVPLDIGGIQEAEVAPRIVGTVEVEVSQASTTAARRARWAEAAAIGVISVLLAAVLALRASRRPAHEVRELARAIERIGAGHLAVRTDARSSRELEALALGINRMAAAMQDARDLLESRIRSATGQLRAEKASAERLSEAKSRFLAAVGHDLRQPLHAIVMLAAGIRRAGRRSEIIDMSQRLESAASSLDTLFAGMVDAYRLETGTSRVDVRDFPLEELLASLRNEFMTQATISGLRFRVAGPRAMVRSDPILLHRLVSNLLSNALRYTNRGAVMLACRSRPQGIRIEVRDSGPGVAATPYDGSLGSPGLPVRAPSAGTGGAGIGLQIAQALASALGIEIAVRSIPGAGSVFAVEIPRALPAGRQGADRVVDTAAQPDRGAAIVLVDPDVDVRATAAALVHDGQFELHLLERLEELPSAGAGIDRGTVLLLVAIEELASAGHLQVVSDFIRGRATGSVRAIAVVAGEGPVLPEELASLGFEAVARPLSASRLRALLLAFASQGVAVTLHSGKNASDPWRMGGDHR